MNKSFFVIAFSLMFLCLIAPHAAMAVSGPWGIDIHGFASQGYLSSDEYNYLSYNSKIGSFEYSEAGINFAKQLTDKMRACCAPASFYPRGYTTTFYGTH